MAEARDALPWLAGLVGTAVAFAVLYTRRGVGEVVDLRDASRNVTYKRGGLAGTPKRTARRPRDIADVTGITLHQWGVKSVGKAAHRKVTAHFSVGHDGTVYYVHPVETWLAASHGFNRDTVSIEVAGLYGRDSIVPQATVDGARRAVLLAIDEVRRAGGELRHIYAHRQSSNQRAMDPGPDLWRRVAVPSPLTTIPSLTRGSGLPIPTEGKKSWYPSFA